jgi:dihydroorotase-like cyclic amidohydrolase
MLRLPGLIDPHVHLRDPGQTEKEDFYTGTSTALAGGYTTLLDMPNNATPITSLERLQEKIQIAKEKIVCDIGFHFGSLGDNIAEFQKVKDLTTGLKIFLNHTTGNFVLSEEKLEQIFTSWPKEKVILFHAEEEKIDLVIRILKKYPRPVHICHTSSRSELERVMQAKEQHLPITCGVTPHHLFLTDEDAGHLEGFGKMKPTLKTRKDVDFLWSHLKAIDCIESDHAPHTLEEKKSDNPQFGVPGLETTLPLLATAMHDHRITIEEIVEKCHTNPAKIFNIPTDSNTYIEVDEKEKYEIRNEELFTKCKWSPFNGWKVYGKVKKVTLRGEVVFENGKVQTTPGTGKVIL